MQNLGKTEKRKRGRPAIGRDPSITIRIPAPLLEWIDCEAKDFKIGRSDMVRRLIEESRLGQPFQKWPRSRIIPPRVPDHLRTTRTSYHEAGHAVMARLFGVSVESATIKPNGRLAGFVSYSEAENPELWARRDMNTCDWWFASITITMAARQVEERILNFESDKGDFFDRKDIREIIRYLREHRGFTEFDAEAAERELRKTTSLAVRALEKSIAGVARALLTSETIGQKRIDRIIAKYDEIPKARRLILECWASAGLIAQPRRRKGVPKRRATDKAA